MTNNYFSFQYGFIMSSNAFIASTEMAMEAVTYLTSHWADRGDLDIRIEAAFAKLYCSEMAWRIASRRLVS